MANPICLTDLVYARPHPRGPILISVVMLYVLNRQRGVPMELSGRPHPWGLILISVVVLLCFEWKEVRPNRVLLDHASTYCLRIMQ